MKSKTLKNKSLLNKKKYGGMYTPRGSKTRPRGSQKRNSKERVSMPQVSMPLVSMPLVSMPHTSMPQIVRIKPSFEEELKTYCMNNFLDSGYIYDEYTEILPGIYKDDIKKRNTMYLLIFIISMLSVMLKNKCKIIIKGGLAVLFAVSSHQESIPYSTKDIDLLIIPLDGNDGLFHAQFIGNMIMWIFEGIDKESRFNKLSLLDESAREIQEKQLLKISMINDSGKFTAAIDINIHLPDDKRFYWPDEKYTFTTYNEDGFGPVLFHEKQPFLFFPSKRALIFDRMLHLLKYNHLIQNVSYIESIAMDVIKYHRGSSLEDALPNMSLARKLTHAEKDEVRQKIYELSTKKSKTHKADPNEIYLASIKKSLTALIVEDIVSHTKTSKLRQQVLKTPALSSKSKEDVFDQFLDDAIKKHNALTLTESNIKITDEQREKLKNYILS